MVMGLVWGTDGQKPGQISDRPAARKVTGAWSTVFIIMDVCNNLDLGILHHECLHQSRLKVILSFVQQEAETHCT